jgi:hypothetical protein
MGTLQTGDEVKSLGSGRDVGESMESKLRSMGLNDFNFQPDLPLGFLDVEVTRTSLDTNKCVLLLPCPPLFPICLVTHQGCLRARVPTSPVWSPLRLQCVLVGPLSPPPPPTSTTTIAGTATAPSPACPWAPTTALCTR